MSQLRAEASLVAQMVKCLPAMWETQVPSLGWEDPLEKEMATLSSILAWKIPWTQSAGLKRVGKAEWLHFHFHSVQAGVSLTALVAFLELPTPSASSPLSTTYLIMPGKVHSTWSADVQYWCELKQCNIREDTEIHKQDENPSTSKGLRSPSLVYLLGTLLILLFSFIISYSHIVCSLLFLIFFSFSFLYISLFFLPLFISSSDNVKSSTFYWTFILLILIFL